jgi:hypothetical protein
MSRRGWTRRVARKENPTALDTQPGTKRAAVEAATMSLPKTEPRQLDPEQIERLIRAIERFEKRFDEFADAFLNARFPFGKATDRWRRSA